MNSSIFRALNLVAEIYGRTPLSMQAAALHYKASGISDEKAFTRQLLELTRTSTTFPLPADFHAAQAGQQTTGSVAVPSNT